MQREQAIQETRSFQADSWTAREENKNQMREKRTVKSLRLDLDPRIPPPDRTLLHPRPPHLQVLQRLVLLRNQLR